MGLDSLNVPLQRDHQQASQILPEKSEIEVNFEENEVGIKCNES